MGTKVLSANANGKFRRTSQYKPSTDKRIQQLLMQLGIDKSQYQLQSSFRMYNRIQNNQYLSN